MADKPVTLEHVTTIIVRDDVRRAFGGPAPIADPRECPGCVHHRTAHTSWGCDHCSCGVSIVDLTPVDHCAVCHRVLPARDIVGGECGDCYTVADRLYERTVDR